MTRWLRQPPLLPIVLALISTTSISSVAPVQAQESPATYEGSFTLGWRFVDVDGRKQKYRQHIDIQEGASLFGLNLVHRPDGDFADEIRIDASNLGGSPTESFDVSIRKFGTYNFKLGRRESSYFYEDLILPVELGSPSLANAGDFHHFDFQRVRDFASFEFRLNPRSLLTVAFDRFSKQGESTTTLDIARDEFEMDQPIDERLDEFRVEFRQDWDKATLTLRETRQESDNARTIFLPGQSLGEEPNNNTLLDFYFLDQPTDTESQQHFLSLTLRPAKRLTLTIAGALIDLDLASKPKETSQGIGFDGLPFATDLQGSVQLTRDLQLVDVDVSYLLTPRLSVVAEIRQHQLDQSGGVAFGAETAVSQWDISTQTLEGGFELAIAKGFSVGAGLREERRDVAWTVSENGSSPIESTTTDHTGYFANASWAPSKEIRLKAQFEDSSYDNAFTFASPTDRQRLRLQATVGLGSGFFGSATFLTQDFENSSVHWNTDYENLSIRAGYRDSNFEASIAYSSIDTERSVSQLITTAPGFGGGQQFLFPILFQSDADSVDISAYWRILEVWSVHGTLRLYENAGSFEREQVDYRLSSDIELPNSYLIRLGLRSVDYEEPLRGFNDYTARIVELGLGYRFR